MIKNSKLKTQNSKMQKSKSVSEIAKVIREAQSFFVADYSKIKAKEMTELRATLRRRQIGMKVIKNRLGILALAESGMECGILIPLFKGPTSLIYPKAGDPFESARLIKEMQKKIGQLKVKAAYLDNRLFSASEFDFLANLPPRTELQNQLVTLLSSPLRNIVSILQGLIENLVWTLSQIRNSRPFGVPQMRDSEFGSRKNHQKS